MRSCVLFSGGWDSVASALKHKDSDLLFFDYGQKYMENERRQAIKFATESDRMLRICSLPLQHDQERRNFYMIFEAKRLGYNHVITGNRNLIPLFDKYKDSNWVSLKLLCLLSNLKLTMPIVGWGKAKIVNFVLKNTAVIPYNCYENQTNFRTCDCVNCRELLNLERSRKISTKLP